ncbi:hypothetical protein CSPAE12_07548, partial [Colletotrichum incanum]
WLVIIPDKPGSLAKRFAYGLPDNDEPLSLEIRISIIVYVAEANKEFMEMLESGVYVERGV